MGVTEDINIFASIYHNKRNVPISCVVYNNVTNSGVANYKYNDKREDTIVYYKGQKSGRDDHYIVGGSTLYLEKAKEDEYRYIGLVKSVDLIHRYPIGTPNEYKITLDLNHVHNGYKSGDKLHYVDGIPRGRGKYCFKNSSLHRLSLDGYGSFMSGIIKTNPIV